MVGSRCAETTKKRGGGGAKIDDETQLNCQCMKRVNEYKTEMSDFE